uniref:Uncharacterized protein n=1 Tax=Triticum urartu TaxID=4572 RepID=A0A8R7QWD0_TRIUA
MIRFIVKCIYIYYKIGRKKNSFGTERVHEIMIPEGVLGDYSILSFLFLFEL